MKWLILAIQDDDDIKRDCFDADGVATPTKTRLYAGAYLKSLITETDHIERSSWTKGEFGAICDYGREYTLFKDRGIYPNRFVKFNDEKSAIDTIKIIIEKQNKHEFGYYGFKPNDVTLSKFIAVPEDFTYEWLLSNQDKIFS